MAATTIVSVVLYIRPWDISFHERLRSRGSGVLAIQYCRNMEVSYSLFEKTLDQSSSGFWLSWTGYLSSKILKTICMKLELLKPVNILAAVMR